jgi:hypothetical protein
MELGNVPLADGHLIVWPIRYQEYMYSILPLTFATRSPLFLLILKTVANLTLCATGGKKSARRFGYIVMSNVWWF